MRSFWIISLLCVIAASTQVLGKSCKKAAKNFKCSGHEDKLNDVIASIASLTSMMSSASAAEPEWKLVFKAVSGIAPIDNNDPYLSDPFTLWTLQQPINEDVPEARQLTNTYQGHYKSRFALNWERRNIKEVKVAFMDATGNELMSMVFDAEGSNSNSWFKADRILSSPYDDIISEPKADVKFFSTSGDDRPTVRRSFFINRNYGGCGVDAGWTVVVGKNAPPCTWELPQEAKPIFMYSNKKTYVNWNNEEDVSRAELFAIFVKAHSRYE